MKEKIKKTLRNLLRLMKPPGKVSVSEWAEENRRIDANSAYPGRWSNQITPYLAEIMDAYNDPAVREVIFAKPSQVGGTSCVENILGYIISENPAPSMVVYPDGQLAKSISQNKIQPMIRVTPALTERFNAKKSKILELRFSGMTLYLTGARVASQLASRSIKNLFIDEMDKINLEIKHEGDVIDLAEERVKTFMDYKVFKTSTPTTKYGRIWRAMEKADVIKKPKVQCPHCGVYIELLFKNLKYTATAAGNDITEVWYECQDCHQKIEARQRMAVLRTVRWEIVTQNRERREKVAFWMNTLYSPFVRWEQIVLKWLEAQGDPLKLKNFINSWLGEPWLEARSELEIETVKKREADSPRLVVPDWAELLTAGVDVQANSLYYTIRAWGPDLTSQCVDHGQVLDFANIEYVMNLEYQNKAGARFIVALCAVDSGDRTDEVYDFCLMNSDWAVPVKGASGKMYGNYRVSNINKEGSAAKGQPLIIVDTGKYKDAIAARMQRENGKGAFMFYKDCDEDYALQITAEHKEIETGSWVNKGSRPNHYFDAEVYEFVAADLMGIRKMHLGMEQPADGPAPPPEQAAQINDWITGG